VCNKHFRFHKVVYRHYLDEVESVTIGFAALLDIFPAHQSIDWCKTRSSKPITWLLIANQIELQPSYNAGKHDQHLQITTNYNANRINPSKTVAPIPEAHMQGWKILLLSNTEKMLRAQVISQQNTQTENRNTVTMCHITKYF